MTSAGYLPPESPGNARQKGNMQDKSADTAPTKMSPRKLLKAFGFILKVLADKKGVAFILFFLMIAAALAEAAGISAFLPLIQLIIGHEQDMASVPAPMRFLYILIQKFPDQQHRVITVVTSLSILFTIGTVIRLGAVYYRAKFIQGLRREWRNSLMHQYITGKIAQVGAYRDGTLLNNLINEPEVAQKFLFGVLEVTMLSCSSAVLIMLLWLTHAQSTIACILAALFISILLYPLFIRKPLRLGKRRLSLQQDLTARATENISRIQQIKTFGQEEMALHGFMKTNKVLTQIWVKLAMLNQMFKPLLEWFAVIGLCAAVAIALLVLKSPLAEFSSFFFFFVAVLTKVFSQLARILSQVSLLVNRLPATELVYNWTHGKFDSEDSGGVPFETLQGDIQFKDVSFAFPEEEPLLNNLNMTIPRGKMTVMTGLSGSHKTTLINLITRLLEPSSGQVIIGNRDASSFSLGDWRNRVAVVDRSPFLFDMSIKDSILANNAALSSENLVAAAKRAHAHEFIIQLPSAYESMMNDRNTHLSSGQRQCIAIARAIAKDPELYVLDEPTNATDPDSMQQIQDTIASLRTENKTLLVISHEQEIIRQADVVYTFDRSNLA